MALARFFRLSAHNPRVVRGRYAGEDYYHRTCGLTGDEDCMTVQDEQHMVLDCQHSTLCALVRAHFFEDLFTVPARGNTPAHSLHLFMNQRDVISVAKFVQQLQYLDGLFNGGTYNQFCILTLFPVWFYWLCSFFRP
jgi:hypothetical protein